MVIYMKNRVSKCLLMAVLLAATLSTVCCGLVIDNPNAAAPLITISTSSVSFDEAEKQTLRPYLDKELEYIAFPSNTVFKITPSSNDVVYQVKANNYCEKVNGAWSWIEHLFETTDLRNDGKFVNIHTSGTDEKTENYFLSGEYEFTLPLKYFSKEYSEGEVIYDVTIYAKEGERAETYKFYCAVGVYDSEETVTPISDPVSYPKSFEDVTKDDYFFDAVMWALDNKITTGMDDTRFAPNAITTRGQMVTFLWRAAGCPNPTADNPFYDVYDSMYCYDAVRWAYGNEIVKGISETQFAPDAIVKRSQAVTFLARFANAAAKDDSVNPFTDVDATDYFYDAVLWAAENGITSGTTETTFEPELSCTRGQIVTFIYRNSLNDK